MAGDSSPNCRRSCFNIATSTSLMRTFCQRSLVCIKVAKTNFRQLFSSQKRGMVLVRRRCSSKARSIRLVVRMRLWCSDGQRREAEAGFQIVLQASRRAGKLVTIVSDEILDQ